MNLTPHDGSIRAPALTLLGRERAGRREIKWRFRAAGPEGDAPVVLVVRSLATAPVWITDIQQLGPVGFEQELPEGTLDALTARIGEELVRLGAATRGRRQRWAA